MLLVLVTALLSVLAVYVIAKAVVRVVEVLGLELMTMLLWMGLAEEALERPRPAPRRLADLLPDVEPAARTASATGGERASRTGGTRAAS